MDVVKPAGDPQIGNLATPINSSGFTKALINNLPAYRAGLSAQRRGLEVGMAHGYLLFGPFALTSQFRNTPFANEVGLVEAVVLVVILTLCLSVYSSVGVNSPISTVTNPNPPSALGNSEGWSEFAGSFLVGGIGGAAFAYLIFKVAQSGVLESFGNILG
ncbi:MULTISPECIES: photosystem I reaction center subunit XI [unclassified Leptolyngbya]|uniref:photosystem I reaction center subunit XI n=1 Tax=unclassified Leptolyngbya TaxID=2650499 RepID=UPI001682D82E|nr:MULTISPECIES: photosystem I reaction center subunit XI [unclassified Leptolyngbya]MBD1911513.1 photosystem I reaction center protein subunit XI [Leptolyngbya sp. FACHB-8]MBD2155246.1 photosystem I reaction center protein subunit XI [Leptolyngbya sp. FACHB-16]